MPVDGLAVLKGGIALVGAVKKWLPKQDDADRRLQNEVTFALRKLYFTPDGVISLLRDIAEGERVPETRLRQVLGNFNDRQWQIEGALGQIDFHELKRQLGVSLSTMDVLQQLRWGKINLRREIQSEVNRYGQVGEAPNKRRVRRLITQIEKLNSDIEEIEAVVNTRAKSPTKRTGTSKKRSIKRKSAPRKKAKRKSA